MPRSRAHLIFCCRIFERKLDSTPPIEPGQDFSESTPFRRIQNSTEFKESNSKIRGHLASALADLFGLLRQHLHLGPDVGGLQLEHFLDILGAHKLLGEVE